MAGEKTEKATPKKRRDERKKGNVLISKDVVSLISVFCVFFILKFLFPIAVKILSKDMNLYLSFIGTRTNMSNNDAQKLLLYLVLDAMKIVVPFACICVLISIIMTGIQTKFLFTNENLKFKFSHLNPLQGIKKIISVRSLVELLKNILKIIILLIILYGLIKKDMGNILKTMNMDLSISVHYTMEMLMDMIFRVTMVFVAVAAFDYYYQWWDYEKRLKMSKQEIKEEYKQIEGNPEVKGKIKQLQRQRAQSRMMQAVPQADVIVRNPTHFAVALQYDDKRHTAPIVVAKGQDELALRIVKVGEENHIMVVENKPLARGLYSSTELGDEIPSEYYSLVAELLVEVYKINNRKVK